MHRDIEDSDLPNVTKISHFFKEGLNSDGPEFRQYEQMRTCLWTGRNVIIVAKYHNINIAHMQQAICST